LQHVFTALAVQGGQAHVTSRIVITSLAVQKGQAHVGK